MELLDGGVSLVRIASLVQERGIDFQLSGQLETDFRNGGADQNLIDALKGQPTNTAPSSEAPSSVQPGTGAQPSAPPPPSNPAPPAAPGKGTGGLQVTSHPGGVDIYVDGALKGTTDSADADEGHLAVSDLKPGKHRVRATRDGFETVEAPVNVAAGQALDTPIWLNKAEAPAATPAPAVVELPPGPKFLVHHVHLPIAGISSGGYCQGWMIVNVGYVRYISTDSYHKYLFNSSEVREAKPDRESGGFHIKLATGRNYQFVAVNEKGEPVSPGPVLSEIRYSRNR
jgi:hypothetical protein